MKLNRVYGVTRSLLMYYGQVWKRRRMSSFYGQFIGQGDLAFDVGAHVGNRTGAWRRLGARVVSVEPQPDMLRVLRLLYDRDPRVIIENCGLGHEVGDATLFISSKHPTVSSSTPEWVHRAKSSQLFDGVRWDSSITIQIETLDTLIARHGEPVFCKIDVEGGELDVLRGLSTPIKAVSFEYLPHAIDNTTACIERLAQLGDYCFRHSPVETMRWGAPHWQSAADMLSTLAELAKGTRSGDVYARLNET